MTENRLPTGDSIPEGTMAFRSADDSGDVTFIRRCDICFAAIIEAHDADYQEHVEWHDRTNTNVPPAG